MRRLALNKFNDQTVMSDGFGDPTLHFQCVFNGAELYVWRVFAAAIAMLTAATERVLVAGTVTILAADDTLSDVGGHGSFVERKYS